MTPAQLKRALKKGGWSPADAARELKVARSTVTRWLRGERPIPGYLEMVLKVWVGSQVQAGTIPATGKPRPQWRCKGCGTGQHGTGNICGNCREVRTT